MSTTLTDAQVEALRLAAGRKSGLISAGHSYKTPHVTLRALSKRGYFTHVATAGSYFDMRFQYRITDAGRAAFDKFSRGGAQ